MDMDQFHGDGGHESRGGWKGDQQLHKPATDHGGKVDGANNSGNLNGKGIGHGAGQKLATFHIQIPRVLGVGGDAVITQGS
jgi:hypothetical protein